MVAEKLGFAVKALEGEGDWTTVQARVCLNYSVGVSMYVGNKTDKEKRKYILASLFLTFFFFCRTWGKRVGLAEWT